MEHTCGRECPCRVDLQAAADALAESSRLLSESLSFSSADLVELRFALVRAAKSKVCGAMNEFREHLQASGTPPASAGVQQQVLRRA